MSAESTELATPSTEPIPAALPCPACAKPLPPGADSCPNCGLALGEHLRCVHCRALVDVDTATDVRFVCRICGGVRVPIDDASVVRSATQVELLKQATVARSATTIWRIVAGVVATFGVGSVLVLALVISVASPETPAAVMAGLAAMVPFVFAALAFQKARSHQAAIAGRVEAAWMAAASDIARARGGAIDAPTFAKLTRASEAAADQILERMSSQNLLSSTVAPDGKLQYTLLESGAVRGVLASGQ